MLLEQLRAVQAAHDEQARAANFKRCGCDYCKALNSIAPNDPQAIIDAIRAAASKWPRCCDQWQDSLGGMHCRDCSQKSFAMLYQIQQLLGMGKDGKLIVQPNVDPSWPDDPSHAAYYVRRGLPIPTDGLLSDKDGGGPVDDAQPVGNGCVGCGCFGDFQLQGDHCDSCRRNIMADEYGPDECAAAAIADLRAIVEANGGGWPPVADTMHGSATIEDVRDKYAPTDSETCLQWCIERPEIRGESIGDLLRTDATPGDAAVIAVRSWLHGQLLDFEEAELDPLRQQEQRADAAVQSKDGDGQI